jgi:hypothetical protein
MVHHHQYCTLYPILPFYSLTRRCNRSLEKLTTKADLHKGSVLRAWCVNHWILFKTRGISAVILCQTPMDSPFLHPSASSLLISCHMSRVRVETLWSRNLRHPSPLHIAYGICPWHSIHHRVPHARRHPRAMLFPNLNEFEIVDTIVRQVHFCGLSHVREG